VTGEPELAQNMANQLEQTNNSIQLVPFEDAVSTSIEFFERTRSQWIEIQQQQLDDWRQEVIDSSVVESTAASSLETARDLQTEIGEDNLTGDFQNYLNRSEQNFEDENYFESKFWSFKAISEARLYMLENRQEQVMNEINEELGDVNQTQGENQTQNLTNQTSPTENETTNQTGNMTGQDLVGRSFVNLDLGDNTVTAEAAYVAPTQGYTEDVNINQSNNSVNFEFHLTSPSESAAQAITTYAFQETRTLDEGSYSVTLDLIVDNETVNSTQETFEIGNVNQTEGNTADTET
jgi:hypothetical protein